VVLILREPLEAPAVAELEAGLAAGTVEQDRLEFLLPDLGLAVGRPSELTVAAQRLRIAGPCFVDRRRLETEQLLTREAGREDDVVGEFLRQCGRVNGVLEAPAAVELHRAGAEQGGLRMAGRARPFLDQQAALATPRKIDAECEPHRPPADDEHGRVDHGHGDRFYAAPERYRWAPSWRAAKIAAPGEERGMDPSSIDGIYRNDLIC